MWSVASRGPPEAAAVEVTTARTAVTPSNLMRPRIAGSSSALAGVVRLVRLHDEVVGIDERVRRDLVRRHPGGDHELLTAASRRVAVAGDLVDRVLLDLAGPALGQRAEVLRDDADGHLDLDVDVGRGC